MRLLPLLAAAILLAALRWPEVLVALYVTAIVLLIYASACFASARFKASHDARDELADGESNITRTHGSLE